MILLGPTAFLSREPVVLAQATQLPGESTATERKLATIERNRGGGRALHKKVSTYWRHV